MFSTISQIGIAYEESSLSQNASFGNFSKVSPKPGDRLPYVVFKNEKEQTRNIQEYVTSTKMELLVFFEETGLLNSLQSAVEKYKDIIHITVLKRNHELFDRFGITSDGFYLVRPDMYIAYRSQGVDKNHFENYLTKFLHLL
jgi:hypothetical protein